MCSLASIEATSSETRLMMVAFSTSLVLTGEQVASRSMDMCELHVKTCGSHVWAHMWITCGLHAYIASARHTYVRTYVPSSKQ